MFYFPRFEHERFVLQRDHDVSGISGTGIVAEGVQFRDGTCVIRWCVPGKPRSTVVYRTLPELVDIHGHNGATRVVFLDGERVEGDDPETAGNAHTNAVGAAVA